jgi:hypothetical protein
MMFRGVFTQKKKLWEAMGKIAGEPLEGMSVADDVTGKKYELNYATLCRIMRIEGRAVVLSGGEKMFLVVEAEKNKVRPWDVNEQGEPRSNPL